MPKSTRSVAIELHENADAIEARLGVGEQTGSSAAKSLSTWVNEPLALLFFQCRSPRALVALARARPSNSDWFSWQFSGGV